MDHTLACVASPFGVIVIVYVPATSNWPSVVTYGYSGDVSASAQVDPNGATSAYAIDVMPSVDDGEIVTAVVLSANVLLPSVPSGRAIFAVGETPTRRAALIAVPAR
jgi:hypothetical protein